MQRSKAATELPWDDVRIFLALSRARTVGSAAKQLKVDASTVSRRLAAMEQTLGATLFDRGRNGIEATAAAERLMPVAEEIEDRMTRFADAADALEREVAGLVRIACPADVAEVIVAPLLGELRARHPALRIALDPGEAVVDLTRREADLALRTVRPVRGDLVVTRLAHAQWVLVASAKLARSMGTLRKWQDAPWISWGERTGNLAPARWFSKYVRGVDPVVQSDSLRVQLAAVEQGIGVALIPEPSVAHYGLVAVKLGASLRDDAAAWPVDELFAVTHRALRDVPRVRAVWDLLRARMTTTGSEDAPSRAPDRDRSRGSRRRSSRG